MDWRSAASPLAGIGSPPSPFLVRRFGLLQATALNMINMIGIGPFITIPLLMSAAMPGSGGTLMYLKNEYT